MLYLALFQKIKKKKTLEVEGSKYMNFMKIIDNKKYVIFDKYLLEIKKKNRLRVFQKNTEIS